MKPLTLDEIHSPVAYEALRPELRRRITAEKSWRRVAVGDHCTVHFENRDTVYYQVHEMLRSENSWDNPAAVVAELTAYNPLIPQLGELSATLMLEYDFEDQRIVMLQVLVGLEQHVWLHIGNTEPIRADFDTAQLDDDKISSVQYLKWRLNEVQRQLLGQDGTVLRLVIDHPHYTAQAILSEDTRRALRHDVDE